MELDSRKKSRRDRMMRSKSFDTQEVSEIGRKKVGEKVESSEKDRPGLMKMTTSPLACVASAERMPDRE